MMTKTTDTVAKRLAQLFDSGVGAKVSARLKEVEKEIGPDASVVLPDFADPTMAILTLDPSSTFDQAAITAFNKAGLDPKDPIHWRLLVILFSWAHFGKWRFRGRPPEWITRHEQLLHDFYTIKNEKGEIKDIAVCRILRKRYSDRYAQSAERLAKEVKRAQDPKFNPTLAHLLKIFVSAEKRDYQRKNIEWSSAIEAEKKSNYLEMLTAIRKKKKGGIRPD